MLTLDLKKLIKSISETEKFELPDMGAGEDYLYNKLFKRLSRGEEVRLSEIDYNSFGLDDINFIRSFYSDTIEANEFKADKIAGALRELSPVTVAAAFV